MKKFSVALFIGIVFLFLGCNLAKTHRKDGCSYCRNAFNTNVQSTELRIQDGSVVANFDNIGCAMKFKALHSEYNDAQFFIHDKNENIFSNAEDLRYNDIDLENYPHRYFASVDGVISFQELEAKIRSELKNVRSMSSLVK